MKKLIFAALIGLFSFTATAQTSPPGEMLTVGTTTDTAKSNTTKTQTKLVSSKKAITVEVAVTHITDTITGYVSIWGSVDGVTYAPWPGADSVAITATANVSKIWFLSTSEATNQIPYIQVRTRCPSNTTNATSKAYLKSRIWAYN